ncbi:MAG: metallophosphoesterase [Planctomycetota bacterium]|nr:MAG: metallophosphoesterase [Planctomycetota bacterium]
MKQKSLSKLIGVVGLCAVFYLTGCREPGWRFIVTGDSRDGDNGVNTVILGELADEIVDRQVDFVLISGDLVNGYNEQAALQSQLNTWIKTMQPVYDAGIGVYPVRGNHDVGEPAGVTAWNNTFRGAFALPDNGPTDENLLTYSFTHKNVFVIGLDQYIRVRQVNQAWLDMQLAANTQPHIFLFGHEPAFKTQHTACLDDYPDERDAFWASIEKAGGRTYFCGHDHLYNHARVDDDGEPSNDIHQYVVGTAGAPLRNWSGQYDGVNSDYTVENIYHASEFGYCLVVVNGLDVTITWFERVRPGKYKAKERWRYTAAAAVTQR